MQRLRTIIFAIDFNGFSRFRGSMLGGKIDLGVSWRPLGASWRHLRASKRRLEVPGEVQGRSGRPPGGGRGRQQGKAGQGRGRISGPLMSIKGTGGT